MFDNNCKLCVGQQRTVCTMLSCSTVLFSAVNVFVFYEQINDADDGKKTKSKRRKLKSSRGAVIIN